MHVRKLHLTWIRIAALFAALTVSTGCATYRAVPNEDWPKIESGADLRVETQVGELHEFRVQAVEDQKLLGEALELNFTEIARIERRNPNVAAKRFLLILVGGFLTYSLVDNNLNFQN